ncbi:MAG TPA: PqqD family protein [Acidobacteriaceae bacterium]|jgi:hypothetical protein
MQVEFFKRVPEVVEAKAGDQTFLLHVNDWVYLELNESASRIWALLEDAKSVDDVTSDLVREFAVSPETCAAETREFLDLLKEKHFVSVS